MDLAAILGSTQSTFQFGSHGFECRVETVRARFGADDRALAASRDLDSLATLRLSAITFVLEFHVEVEDGGIETLESCELLGNVDPEMIRNFHVASFDDDFGVVRARWSSSLSRAFAVSS